MIPQRPSAWEAGLEIAARTLSALTLLFLFLLAHPVLRKALAPCPKMWQ